MWQSELKCASSNDLPGIGLSGVRLNEHLCSSWKLLYSVKILPRVTRRHGKCSLHCGNLEYSRSVLKCADVCSTPLQLQQALQCQ